jgi:phosphohistidine phosphatase
MRLLIVRHAEAVPADAAGVRDRDRPLTANGEHVFRAAAKGLALRLPAPDVLLASPLLRARQTATLLAVAWGDVVVTPEAALASGSVDAILAAILAAAAAAGANRHDPTIAVVGHEPTVSALLAGLVGAEARGFSPGAAALVETGSAAQRAARLVWFLSPEAAAESSR